MKVKTPDTYIAHKICFLSSSQELKIVNTKHTTITVAGYYKGEA